MVRAWWYPLNRERKGAYACSEEVAPRERERVHRSRGLARLAVGGVLVVAALAAVGSSGSPARAATSPQLMPAAGQFVPITPVTVLDTRNGTGGVATAPVAAGATVTFPVEGVGGIPATGVSDVFEEIGGFNVTGTGALEAYNADDSPSSWTVPITSGQASTVADMTQVSQGGRSFLHYQRRVHGRGRRGGANGQRANSRCDDGRRHVRGPVGPRCARHADRSR